MKDLNKAFAENVFRVCDEKGIKITALAKEHRMTRNQVYGAYNGESSPSLKSVQRWADALGVPAMELLKE